MRVCVQSLALLLWIPAPLVAQVPDPNDLSARVEVLRTAYGVPHIRADDLKAFGYALAWIQL
jgi:acyl-homoserine lactone acylase PvdQ